LWSEKVVITLLKSSTVNAFRDW